MRDLGLDGRIVFLVPGGEIAYAYIHDTTQAVYLDDDGQVLIFNLFEEE